MLYPQLLQSSFPNVSSYFLCACFMAGVRYNQQVPQAHLFAKSNLLSHQEIFSFKKMPSIEKLISGISRHLGTTPLHQNPREYFIQNGTNWFIGSKRKVIYSPFNGIAQDGALPIQNSPNRKRKITLNCKKTEINPETQKEDCIQWYRVKGGNEILYDCIKEKTKNGIKECIRFERHN